MGLAGLDNSCSVVVLSSSSASSYDDYVPLLLLLLFLLRRVLLTLLLLLLLHLLFLAGRRSHRCLVDHCCAWRSQRSRVGAHDGGGGRARVAIGETVILLTSPSSSTLKRPLTGEEGAAE